MEDDLKKIKKIEDDLKKNLKNGRRPRKRKSFINLGKNLSWDSLSSLRFFCFNIVLHFLIENCFINIHIVQTFAWDKKFDSINLQLYIEVSSKMSDLTPTTFNFPRKSYQNIFSTFSNFEFKIFLKNTAKLRQNPSWLAQS